jgi:hypothetical protein
MKSLVAGAVLVVMFAGSAEGQPAWVSIGGGYLSQDDPFVHTISFPEYFEPAHVGGEYPGGGGVLLDVGAGVGLRHGWSVQSSVGSWRRSTDAVLRGAIPHPLYFAQPREVEHVVADLTRRETALRAELAWTRPWGDRVQLTVSGGPVAVHAAHDMATAVRVRETGYPYDAVAVEPGVTTESSWGIGATAAVNGSYVATNRLALGVTGRFSRATVTLRDQDVNADGPSVTATLRIRLR